MTLTKEKRAEYRDRCKRAWCRVPCSKEELLELLDALDEAEAKAPRWIACSERMPEDTERVWFYANERVIKGELLNDQFCTSSGFGWNGGEVTHWQHRPVEPVRPEPPSPLETETT